MEMRVDALAVGPQGALGTDGRPASATLAALLDAAALPDGAVPASAVARPDTPGAALGDRLGTPAGQVLPTKAGHAVADLVATQPAHAAAAADAGGAGGPSSEAGALSTNSGFSNPSTLAGLAAQPLTPTWLIGLNVLPPSLQARLETPRDEERQRRSPRPNVEPDNPDSAHDPPNDEADAAALDLPEAGAAVRPWRTHHPLHDQLPPPLQAELSRGRAVLLCAAQPSVTGVPRPLVQAWWLGFDSAGRACSRRLPVRGEGPREAAWQWWWLKRGGDDGTDPRPHCRPAHGSSQSLALRVCAPAEAPPRGGAGLAWLDLTDPVRLWRDLGTQWTWLTAWSPRPLPWMR